MYCVIKCIMRGNQARVKNADLRHPSCTVVMQRRKSASPVRNVLSNAETFEHFPPRRQAMLKTELATLFAHAEISELDAQSTPASSPHYSASSTGSGLTSDDSNAPQDTTELTDTDLSVNTNLNNAFQPIDFSKCSITDACGNAYLLLHSCQQKSIGLKFLSPKPEVTCGTVAIIIRVVLLSPY